MEPALRSFLVRTAITQALLLAAISTDAGAQLPAPPTRPLVATLRIDGAGHDWATIRAVRVTTDGRILLLTQDQPRGDPTTIRVFSADGSPVGNMGRAGQGPGEFSGISSIGVVGDTIWAGDRVARRVTWFRTDGSVLRVVSADRMAAGGAPSRGSATPHLLGWSPPLAVFADATMLIRPAIGPINGTAPVPIYRTSSSGVVLDTAVVLQQSVGLAAVPHPSEPGRSIIIDNPFAAGQWAAVSVDGRRIAIVGPDFAPNAFTIHLRVMGGRGEPVLDRRYPFAREPIPAREVDSVVSATVARVPGLTAATVRQAMQVPLGRQPVTGLLVDRDGSVWIRGPGVASGVTWTIVSPGGELAFTVREPRGARLVALDRGLWAVVRDASDVESLVRYSSDGSTGVWPVFPGMTTRGARARVQVPRR
jgi:hypothetical protein